MPKNATRRYVVVVSEETHKKLKRTCARLGIWMEEATEAAIKAWLARNKKRRA